MRLTEAQRTAITSAIRDTFGAETKTWLFGSRTDDLKKGGDIDLLVEVPHGTEGDLRRTLRAVGRIQRQIGDQKIDLVVTNGTPEQERALVIRSARSQAVLL